MRVFGYSSVSTTEQDNGGLSLDTQKQQITGYAMMKGWQVRRDICRVWRVRLGAAREAAGRPAAA
jgi:DNA invertase Pin-like site-specific DNA recombinase